MMKWYDKNILLIFLLGLIWFIGLLVWLYFTIDILGLAGQYVSIISGGVYGCVATFIFIMVFNRFKLSMNKKSKEG